MTKTQTYSNYKLVIGGLLAIIVIYIIGNYAGNKISDHSEEIIGRAIGQRNTPDNLIKKEWLRVVYGGNFSIKTPVSLTNSNIAIPNNIKDYIDTLNVFEIRLKNGLEFAITLIKYKPAIGEIDLQGASNIILENLKKSYDLTNLKYTYDSIFVDNTEGQLLKGTFKEEIINYKFVNASFVSGLNLWQVMLIYSADDKNGQKLADRVISSIKIQS